MILIPNLKPGFLTAHWNGHEQGDEVMSRYDCSQSDKYFTYITTINNEHRVQ